MFRLVQRPGPPCREGNIPASPASCCGWDGGPSHKDTFDLRPGTEQGGPFRNIQTSGPRRPDQRALPPSPPPFDESWRHQSQHDDGEGAHASGQVLICTPVTRKARRPVLSQHRAPSPPRKSAAATTPLPQLRFPSAIAAMAPAILGHSHQPAHRQRSARGVENLAPRCRSISSASRMGLLQELEQGFHRTHQSSVDTAHSTTYQGPFSLMLDRGNRVFDIQQ